MTTLAPHPTIPGVVVEETETEPGRVFRQTCYYDAANDTPLVVSAVSDDPDSLQVDTGTFSVEHAETVIAMIRDFATWMTEQGATP